MPTRQKSLRPRYHNTWRFETHMCTRPSSVRCPLHCWALEAVNTCSSYVESQSFAVTGWVCRISKSSRSISHPRVCLSVLLLSLSLLRFGHGNAVGHISKQPHLTKVMQAFRRSSGLPRYPPFGVSSVPIGSCVLCIFVRGRRNSRPFSGFLEQAEDLRVNERELRYLVSRTRS